MPAAQEKHSNHLEQRHREQQAAGHDVMHVGRHADRGTPDQVGGFDHLLVMQQAGFLDHARTVQSMTLFAKEVLPQIRELARTRPNNAKGAAE
jgi:hypothetical protein